MRFAIYIHILCGLILTLGCTDTENPVVDVPEAEAITTEMRIQDLTEEERGKKVIEHLKKYLELKERSPKAAYAELRKSADLTWWGPPLAEEWAQLGFRIDMAGKASIMDMIQRVELELKMVKERSPYEEQTPYLEANVQFWREKKEFAEAVGNDPNEANIKWSIKVEDD